MLMNALRQIAESLGYRFLAGREERLAPLTRGLPAVWVTPLRLRKAEGRAWRRDTYAVRLRLIAPSVSQEPEAGWQTLGGLEMFHAQADAQFFLWTGEHLPATARQALEAALRDGEERR